MPTVSLQPCEPRLFDGIPSGATRKCSVEGSGEKVVLVVCCLLYFLSLNACLSFRLSFLIVFSLLVLFVCRFFSFVPSIVLCVVHCVFFFFFSSFEDASRSVVLCFVFVCTVNPFFRAKRSRPVSRSLAVLKAQLYFMNWYFLRRIGVYVEPFDACKQLLKVWNSVR